VPLLSSDIAYSASRCRLLQADDALALGLTINDDAELDLRAFFKASRATSSFRFRGDQDARLAVGQD